MNRERFKDILDALAILYSETNIDYSLIKI